MHQFSVREKASIAIKNEGMHKEHPLQSRVAFFFFSLMNSVISMFEGKLMSLNFTNRATRRMLQFPVALSHNHG